MNFKGKVALITGGGSGMGRASALGFSRHGAKVVVVDRDTTGGDGTVDIIRQQGGEALFVAADVTKSVDVQAYVKAAVDAYGAIDCFHNNAGIEGAIAPISEYDEQIFDAVMSVNVKGVFLGLRHVLPVMLKQKRGAIVNTASTHGLIGPPGMSAYIASKHAVIGLTKCAAGEVARSGVRVNAVCPGAVDTPMIHRLASAMSPDDPGGFGDRYQSTLPIGRYGTAGEIANLVLFLCSDLASNITGAQYVSDGGRTATGGSPTANLVR